MNYDLTQALQLVTRWFHVVVGVYWIGQTALFSWLDTRLRVEEDAQGNQELWMVHSGGFYRVERRSKPETGDRPLHWFKWEAALTWISGVMLLALVYYFGGVMVDPSKDVDLGTARMIGIGTLVLGWVMYDALWISPLAKKEGAMTWVSTGLLIATAFGLSQFLSGRATFIHVGALMGTVMAANVWMRILPAQKQMVEAVRQGREVDQRLGKRAKQRSTHNTFLAVPLIFMMISSHFPTLAYGREDPWIAVTFYLLLGFGVRGVINRYQRAPVKG